MCSIFAELWSPSNRWSLPNHFAVLFFDALKTLVPDSVQKLSDANVAEKLAKPLVSLLSA